MLPKWTVNYIIDNKISEVKEVDVYGETVFQAWFNAMNLIQIKEKTENYIIRSVNPKKSS